MITKEGFYLMYEENIEMLRLGFDDEYDRQRYLDNKISVNKKMSRIYAKSRQRAKHQTCYICKKECSSFCNSHSVPKFCLKRVATEGKVYMSGIQAEFPVLGEDNGVNDAGTFHLICRECDGTLFQDYENPGAYAKIPTGKMLAQIVMKNYLLMISKRFEERALYSIMAEQFHAYDYAMHHIEIIDLDLVEYESEFKRAKIAGAGNHDDWYYLCYYQQLDYVVPFAFQGPIVMVSDFEDNVINDIYNMSPDYHTKDIHIAVFPLEKTSIVMMIVDSREKRYRKFYKQLKKLPLQEQLSAINYIIFSYSENVFISKNIGDKVLKNKYFLEACQKCNVAVSDYPFGDALSAAIREFSLSKRKDVPNLLSAQYALIEEI